MPSILVLGTGELGLAIITALISISTSNNTTINVLVRPTTFQNPPPSLQNLLLPGSISLVAADISTATISDLSTIFSKYDVVLSCMGYAAGRSGIQIKIAQAALEARVKRFYPWQFGVDYDVIGKGSAQDLFDEQLDVRYLLRSQKETGWLIISTGMFMSFLFEEWFQVVEGLRGDGGSDVVVRALGSWENRVTVTSVEDIAKITARLVVDEPGIKDQVVFTSGQTLSYRELADAVEKVTGAEVRKEVLELAVLKEKLEKEPDNTIFKYQVFFGEGKGVAWDMEKTYNWQKGIPTTGVEQWLRKALAKDEEK